MMTSIAPCSAFCGGASLSVFLLIATLISSSAKAAPFDDCFKNGLGHACLVTGNGYGYATIDSTTGALNGLLAHPYRRIAPDPLNKDGDGIFTTRFIVSARWKAEKSQRAAKVHASYVDQSQVVSSRVAGVSQNYFMPMKLHRHALVTTSDGQNAGKSCLNVSWLHKVLSTSQSRIGGRLLRAYTFDGVNELLVAATLEDDGVVSESADETQFCGSSGWAFMSVDHSNDLAAAASDLRSWIRKTPARDLVSREVRELNDERMRPTVHLKNEAYRKLYRQSETMLKIGQIGEANGVERSSHGLINASLPPGEFSMPFVRDMSYATVGLSDSGQQEMAKDALSAFMNAGGDNVNLEADRGVPYQVSTVRYFGNGQEDADISGEKFHNIEFDCWGLSLWALSQYHEKYHDLAWLNSVSRRGTIYESTRDFVVKPLLANLDSIGANDDALIVAKDTSVWEQNDEDKSHYAASTIAALSGLRGFARIASDVGDSATAVRVSAFAARLEKGFLETFAVGNHMIGRPVCEDGRGRNLMDGSLLDAINTGVLKDPALVHDVLDRMESIMKMPSGGYRRVGNGSDEYELHEFVFTDFNLARAYLRAGQLAKADAIVDRLVKKANADNGIIPEMYVSRLNDRYLGQVGDPAGAAPMIGYGAGAYMLYLSERDVAGRKVAEAHHAEIIDISATDMR